MSIKNIVTGQLAKITTYSGIGQVRDISTTGNITTAANLVVGGVSELGPVGNVAITGGSAGEVLSTDGSGNLSWTPNPIYVVPPVYLVAPSAGNNQSFSNTILASYNSNTDMTVFYNGSLLENTYYTLAGDVLTVNIPLQVGDGIDVVTTVSSNVNSIVTSAYGNSNVAAYLPTYIGSLPSLTGDVTTTANVTAAKVSLGAGNLQLAVNTVSSAADLITIDPLGDGTPAGNVVVAGNLQVAGTLTYNNIVNATTNDLQWIAANNAINPAAATGAGLAVGPLGAYASFTYNNGSNLWQSSLPILANGGVNANGALSGATTGSFSGNVTADYFTGNGSQLTGLYANSNVANYLASNANVVITTTGNITSTGNIVAATIGNAATVLFGDGSNIAGLPAPYTDTDVSLYLASGIDTAGFETTGNVTADYFIGNGSQLTGLPASYTNANVAAYLPTYTGNLTAGNVVASGNITGDYFIGNGSQLTGIFPIQASFAKYKRTTAQTGISANSAVICNVAEAFSGPDISVNTTTGSITLQPNKTYRLRGTVGDALRLNSGDTCAINFQWFNVTAGALLGTDTFYVSPSSSSNEFYYAGTAEAVFTPTVTTVVQLRITNFSNINSIGSALSAQSFPWVDIEVIGGAMPFTDSYTNANVATYLASNANVVITTTGNITTAGLVSATGNVTGGNIKANTAVFIGTRSIQNPPTFSATGSVSTVITAVFTDTLVAYNNEILDPDGWFASNRYTPQLAGYYQISCGARLYVPASGQTNERSLLLRKNGAAIGASGGYGAVTGTISQLVYLNGTTDYVDVAITSANTGTVPQSTSQTYFTGYWVRP